MKLNNKVPSQTLINRKKYSVLCSLLRGSSVTANPEYLTPGGVEALNDLEQEGICFLDKTGIQASGIKHGEAVIDPGDSMGRYRIVNGKQGLAQEMADQLEK